MSSEVANKDPQELIQKFYSQAEEIVNSFARKLDEEPPPSLIYHYTDGAGLRGILESGKLWFTDIFNLHDPAELRHGLNYAVGIIKARAAVGTPELKMFYDAFQAMVNWGIEQTAHYFVCCFSKDDDDLGQWRAYADNGRGYAIGFDGGLLVQAFVASGTDNHSTFPITYRDNRLHKMHKKIIDKFIPLLSLRRGGNLVINDLTDRINLATSFSVQILRSALFFKHKAYINEQEYRFLQLYASGVLDGVKYRGRPYSLIRYREFDWRSVASGSLKKIIIGPAADRRVAGQFADECLRAFHLVEGLEISQSRIPYRAP